jgi:cell division transport system ATP-binding protein
MNNKVIDIQGLDVYQSGNLILNNVNFSLNKGEAAYLIGKTGQGKTSLLKTLYGELDIHKGHAQVVGIELVNIKQEQIPYLRRKLGIVFQDFNLLTDRNVFENLSFVLRCTGWTSKIDIEKRIDDVLNQVGILHKKHNMPYEMSGGEQQRVVIARALLNNPELILADEPTGNLDPETSEEIIKLMFDICAKLHIAMIVATHDYSLIEKYPSLIIRCKDKNIEFEKFLNRV